MNLTKNQLWALLIAFIMLSSTIGFLRGGLLGNTGSNPAPEPNPQAQPPEPTTVNYGASNVEATIIQLFPTAVIIGTTQETDALAVRQELESLEGILAAENAQVIAPQEGRSENFRAELRLSGPEAIAQIVPALNSLGTLSNPELFPQALVSLPGSVEFSNPSLDLSIEHTFSNPQSQAFVTSGSLPGDELVVSLSAVFRGQSLVEMVAFEEENLTSGPGFYFFEDTFVLDSLNDEFFVRASLPLPERAKLDSAKASLESGFSGSSLLVEPLSSDLRVNFVDSNSFFWQDLEIFLEGFEGVVSYDNQLASGFSIVAFDPGVDYAEFRSSLESGLNSLGFAVASIEDPVVSFQGTVPAGKEEFLASVASLESELAIDFEVLRRAVIEADSLSVPDENVSFALPRGSFTAFVSPERQPGEGVSLSIIMNASERSGVTDIQAQETPEDISVAEN